MVVMIMVWLFGFWNWGATGLVYFAGWCGDGVVCRYGDWRLGEVMVSVLLSVLQVLIEVAGCVLVMPWAELVRWWNEGEVVIVSARWQGSKVKGRWWSVVLKAKGVGKVSVAVGWQINERMKQIRTSQNYFSMKNKPETN